LHLLKVHINGIIAVVWLLTGWMSVV